LLKAHRGVCAEIESLEFKKRSTRIETYSRLRRARDYMDANFQNKLRLPEISGEAFMASHHFLRMFKQAFQITPHQYLTLKRLDLARDLLRHSDMSVTAICLEIGFESLGSFSALFTNRFGVSPLAYRRGANLRIVLGHDVAA
jgi:AraC family transcriptional regulator